MRTALACLALCLAACDDPSPEDLSPDATLAPDAGVDATPPGETRDYTRRLLVAQGLHVATCAGLADPAADAEYGADFSLPVVCRRIDCDAPYTEKERATACELAYYEYAAEAARGDRTRCELTPTPCYGLFAGW
jgi:hypothetical protein